MSLAEGIQIATFGLLALTVIVAALGVVLLSKIVYSAFLLGVVFLGIAGLYVLLNADFVAAAQILIYVGAVNVLILFAIMLVNKQQPFLKMPNAWIRKGVTAVVCFGLFALLGATVLSTSWAFPAGVTASDNSVLLIGQHFFSDFLLPFELASVFLLMAMVGAIILARRDFIPEEPSTKVEPIADLKLPERPRQLVGADRKGSG